MRGLHEVAASLVAPGKGILAADESIATMSRRLEAAGVVPSAGTRRDYRLLLTTLAAINAQAARGGTPPWQLTFSFGRALVSDALRAWHGVAAKAREAQNKLAANCRRASEASRRSVAAAAGA